MTHHVLCLNPAMDKMYVIDGFTAGEDYPGCLPDTYVGGKGINVARVLSQLGETVCLYAFLGETGSETVAGEMNARCTCCFVPVPGACRTTINIIDRVNGRETVITEAGPRVSAEHVERLLGMLAARVQKGDIVCCSGSVIAGAPADIYAKVSHLCDRLGAHCTLDANAKVLASALKDAHYMLGKPNERELCALLGVPRTADAVKLVSLAQRMMPPYEQLLVSMGARGGVLVQKTGAWAAEIPMMKAISTVGSGDACFAGALAGLARSLPPEEILRLAMACGIANAKLAEPGSIAGAVIADIARSIAIRTLL